MKPVIFGFPDGLVPFPQPVHLTIGTFDGLHKGHQSLLKSLINGAHAVGAESMVVTFDPHPRCVVDPNNCPGTLTTLNEKLFLLEQLGIDHVIVIRFDRDIAALTPSAFMKKLMPRMPVRRMLVGPDFRFGHGRRGDAEFLRTVGKRKGFSVEVSPTVTRGGEPISSSRIRRLILLGQMRAAAQLLGRDYLFQSVVEHGEKRGRKLGYPTANFKLPSNKLIPASGVYAARVEVDSVLRSGALSVGYRPTFGGQNLTVEVFILDFEGDLYGQTLNMWVVQRLRGEKRFASVAGLTAQMARDVENARRILAPS